MLVMRGRQPRWRPGMNAGFNGGGGGEQDALRTRKVLCTILLFMLLWESTGYRHMAMQARQQREMRRRGVAGGGAYPGESGLADALALGGSPSYADIHIDNHGGLPRDATGDARGAFCKRHGSQRRCLSFCCTAPPLASVGVPIGTESGVSASQPCLDWAGTGWPRGRGSTAGRCRL